MPGADDSSAVRRWTESGRSVREPRSTGLDSDSSGGGQAELLLVEVEALEPESELELDVAAGLADSVLDESDFFVESLEAESDFVAPFCFEPLALDEFL